MMGPIIVYFRRILVSISFFLGIEKLLVYLKRPGYLILNYHGVVKTLRPELSKNHMSVEQFEAHLKYYSENYEVIPLESLISLVNEGVKPSRPTVAITFDDGYENNFSNAFPLLKQYNFPATIFVTAQAISKPGEALWYDALDICRNEIDWKSIIRPDSGINFSDDSANSTAANFEQFKKRIKSLTADKKQALFMQLFPGTLLADALSKAPSEYWNLLNPEQIKELSTSGIIEIGSHGLSHTNLDLLSEEALKIELRESKILLEQACASPVISIAFPDGAYTNLVKTACMEQSYKTMLAVNYRCADDDEDSNIFERFSIPNTSITAGVMTAVRLAFLKKGN